MGASKKMVGVSTLPFLPPEILFEILAKLPAKSIARFKCVSKFFNSLTCDPLFAYRHRSLSLTLPNRASILISINRPELGLEFYTINFSEENQGKLQANPIRFSHGEIFRKGRLGSSSDGLICQSKTNGDITICNISMRQRISLPRIQFQLDPSSTCARLGFDSFTKKYKVLMSVKFIYPECINKYKHWVFTLGVDESWREINSPHLSQFYPFDISPSFYHPNSGVYINGVIYSYNSLTDEIGAFEVGADNLSTIPFPDEVLEQYYYIDGKKYHFSYFFLKKFALVEVDGRLAMVLFRRTREDMFSMDVWTWEEAKEWKKLTIRIPLEGSQIINKDCLSRFTTNHAGEIMILCIHSEHFSILVCNFKSKIWRKFDVGGVEDFPIPCYWEVNMFNIIDNVFSLK